MNSNSDWSENLFIPLDPWIVQTSQQVWLIALHRAEWKALCWFSTDRFRLERSLQNRMNSKLINQNRRVFRTNSLRSTTKALPEPLTEWLTPSHLGTFHYLMKSCKSNVYRLLMRFKVLDNPSEFGNILLSVLDLPAALSAIASLLFPVYFKSRVIIPDQIKLSSALTLKSYHLCSKNPLEVLHY